MKPRTLAHRQPGTQGTQRIPSRRGTGSKRGNSEGSITKRADGRYEARISLDDGKRKSYYAKTRQEAARLLTQAMRDREAGLPIVGERQTIQQYLASWLETTRPTLRPRTWTRYEQLIRVHVVPTLGLTRLAKLTPQQVQTLYAQKLREVSTTTVHHLHAVLHKSLAAALRLGLVQRNVTELVDPPRMRHHEMATLTPEQAHTFLAAAADDRLAALYTLALTTGMREGELFALKWRDVDLDAGKLQVRGTLQRTTQGLVISAPKTPRSRRSIALAATAIAALRQHRTRQVEEKLAVGPVWEDNGLVFCTSIGSPLDAPSFLRREYYPLLARAGLPRIRFHDLRHTAATLFLRMGVHPKVVAEMLGHATISITLDTYSHVLPDLQREATAAMDRLLKP